MQTRRFLARVAASATVALCLSNTQPPIQAQGSRPEHWVGTWATAVVARLPDPQGAAAGFGAGLTSQCFGATPARSTPSGR